MIDTTVNEYSAMLMQAIANQRSAGFDDAAKLAVENQLLKSRLAILQARIEELEASQNPAEAPQEAGN